MLYDPDGLWAFYLGPAELLARLAPGVRLNRDALPLFEFISSRSTKARRRDFASNGWPRLSSELLANAPSEDPLFPGRPLALARGGQELAALNRFGARARMWRSVRALLPAHLLQQRDDSVSEAWPPSSP